MASTYLTRTPSSAGSTRKMTISFWYKKCANGSQQAVITQNNSGATVREIVRFQTDDTFSFYTNNGSYQEVNTNRVFRDNSAFYHIVIEVDTTQATAADRVKIYVNGVQETSFATSNYPAQNFDFTCWNSTNLMVIGRDSKDNNTPVDGVMAHFHFIDGTAYDASYFGQTETSSGIWKPKLSPSVTYGTNGFFLKFQDSSSLGDDSSGNTNDFTLNGSGTQTLDTPSNVFATLNPLKATGSNATYSNGNLRFDGDNSSTHRHGISTLAASSGKWYWEYKQVASGGNYPWCGIANIDNSHGDMYFGQRVDSWGFSNSGAVANDGSTIPGVGHGTYSSLSNGDIVGVAVDLDNNKLYFSKNGTWQNSADPAAGTGGLSITANLSYGFGVSSYNGGEHHVNFGNGYFGTTAVASANSDSAGIGQFEYSVPSGYYAWCTKNIAEYG